MAVTFFLVFALLLSGCMTSQLRRMAPNNPQEPQQDLQIEDPNQTGQGLLQQGQREDFNFSPQSQVKTGQDNWAPYISATYEKADIEYVVTTKNVAVKSGASENSSVIYRLPSGSRVSVVGKQGNNYVIYLPSNKRVGMIPVQSTKPITSNSKTSIPDVPGAAANSLTNEETQMLNLINQERSKNGLKPLKANSEIAKIARLKSKDIADNNYFSHTSPTYGSPFEMLKKYGISYLYAGENLAKNSNVQAAHQALMNSAGHRKNILSNNFTEVGIGIISSGDGSMKVYTQMFIGR